MEQNEGLTLQQRVLGFGALNKKEDAVVDYATNQRGERVHLNTIPPEQYTNLVQIFKKDPKEFAAYCRLNLLKIKTDPKISPEIGRERHERYVDQYLELLLKLDHDAFPPSEQVFNGVPDYIPDGLSDMGGDDEVDQSKRGREKIRVDKRKIFAQSKDLLHELFSIDPTKANNEQIKQYIIDRVAHYVYTQMPYDYSGRGADIANPLRNQSVRLDEVRDKRLAVCRHHALYTQVLLQALGITTKLMKSELTWGGNNLGPHVNNLVRVNGQWHLLDTTNPEVVNGQGRIFHKPIPEKNPDLNSQSYTWDFKSGDTPVRYRTRNNMYYRIRDNSKS